MAIVSVNKIDHKSDFSGNKRRYTEEYRVITDDPNDDGHTVSTADGIPTSGRFYSLPDGSLDWSYVADVSASYQNPRDSRLVWTVTVRYEPVQQGQEDEELDPDNPFALPPRLEYSNGSVQEVAKRAWFMNGILGMDYSTVDVDPLADISYALPRPVMNAAGEPFRTPLMRNVPILVATITRNEAAYSPAVAIQGYDAINADPFLGADPYCVKCTGYVTTGLERTSTNVPYYPITYTFAFRQDTWLEYVENRGFRQLIDADHMSSVRIFGEDDQSQPDDPVWLKSDGTRYDIAAAGARPEDAENYRVYAVNRPVAFSTLFNL